jgi:hypothetical protein
VFSYEEMSFWGPKKRKKLLNRVQNFCFRHIGRCGCQKSVMLR